MTDHSWIANTRTPITITTDDALGLTQAIDVMWPKSLRIRC